MKGEERERERERDISQGRLRILKVVSAVILRLRLLQLGRMMIVLQLDESLGDGQRSLLQKLKFTATSASNCSVSQGLALRPHLTKNKAPECV